MNSPTLRRRTLLKVGALALGQLTLADLLRLRGHAGRPAADTAVIQVFMGGGPSHIDLYDLKPAAPTEVRGEFRPIATTVPGLEIGELLPCLAQVAHRIAFVRSATHSDASHLPASHWMMTGYRPPPSTTSNVNPSVGAVVARARGANVAGLPAYVSVPRRQLLGASSYLGSAFNPFAPDGDPNAANFAVRNLDCPRGLDPARLADRDALAHSLDRLRDNLDRDGQFAGIDRFSRAALELVTSVQAQRAFDLSREDPATRDRYGRSSAGQGCLLARRLVEAGVTFVTVLSGGEWDTHTDNFSILKNRSVPSVDRALAALVEDLTQRGLDQRVLVLVTGEFGRTPRINAAAGRDHWPGAFTVLFAGGGLRVGQVVGATDAQAAYPITRPYSPGDILATIYRHLTIDTHQVFYDRSGRPLPLLAEGTPIAELVG